MLARWLMLLSIVGAAGCDRLPLPNLDLFSGTTPERSLPFRARLVRDGRLDPNFSITVNARGSGLEAIRESVRYPATRYCLSTFGSSEIDWRASGTPDAWIATPAGAGRLIFRGRCDPR